MKSTRADIDFLITEKKRQGQTQDLHFELPGNPFSDDLSTSGEAPDSDIGLFTKKTTETEESTTEEDQGQQAEIELAPLPEEGERNRGL